MCTSASNARMDLGLSSLYNTCYHDSEVDMTKNYEIAGLYFIPFMLLILASITLDFIVYLKMKNLVNPQSQAESANPNQENIVNKVVTDIPIISSLMNSLFLIPYLVIPGIVAGTDLGENSRIKMEVTLLPVLLVNFGRVWLLTTCTFKLNEANRRRGQEEERERRRKIEINDAFERKKERDRLKQGKLKLNDHVLSRF